MLYSYLYMMLIQTILARIGLSWPLCLSFCVHQVAPGVLWSACMWGHKEGARVSHWRLFIFCRVLCHHCSLCLLVFPHGHHRIHLLSEQIPWKQPRATYCECSGLLNYKSATWCCGFLSLISLVPLVSTLLLATRTLWWQWCSPSCGWSAPLLGPRLCLMWKWPLIPMRCSSSSLPAKSRPTSVAPCIDHTGLGSTPQW